MNGLVKRVQALEECAKPREISTLLELVTNTDENAKLSPALQALVDKSAAE